MAFSHTHGKSFSSGSSTITASKTYSGGSEVNVDETLAIGTNTAVSIAVDVSALVSLYIKADSAATLKVNSTGAPTKTIALVADEPYTWPMGSNTDPLGASDVTVIYVTNAAECGLQIRALVDPTP